MNWQHFKGYNKGDGNAVYTYINLSTLYGSTVKSNPKIKVYDTDPYYADTDTELENHDLGYIITTDATGQYFSQDISFQSKIQFWGASTIPSTFPVELEAASSKFNVKGTNSWECNFTSFKSYNFDTGDFTVQSNNIKLGKKTEQTPVLTLTQTSAKFEVPCTTIYVDTTSDMRAKRCLTEANYNALDIVKSLKTYTFDYKDNDVHSYGIIAQDIKDVVVNGFSFVDNPDASGENGDYMQVKESKLIYLLLEAVKQQQAEIEELKAQLKNK